MEKVPFFPFPIDYLPQKLNILLQCIAHKHYDRIRKIGNGSTKPRFFFRVTTPCSPNLRSLFVLHLYVKITS